MAKADIDTLKKKILIVDDHPLYRDGLRRFVESQPDLVCCGEGDTVQSIHEAFRTTHPDLITLDLRLRGDDAMRAIKDFTLQYPGIRLLVLSQKDEAIFAEPCLRAGARGYIMKEEATEELLNAIRAVLRGEIYVSHRLSGLILNRFISGVKGNSVAERLSDRELQVFQLLGSGLGPHQIADQLHLSVKTVETHRENIKHKLGFQDAGSLAAAEDWVQSTER